MISPWLITFRSITYAQKAQSFLQRTGFLSALQRTPVGLSDRGCSYCLRLRERDGAQALQHLQDNGIHYSKVFTLRAEGRWEERLL